MTIRTIHSRSNRTPLAAAALLLAASAALVNAQIAVQVDSTQNWVGYLNWFDTNDVYVGGGAWGTADLRAAFDPNPQDATGVVLGVNTNTYNPEDPFWNNPDGSPAKHLEANFYVDVGTDFAGEEVTFTGFVEANTIPESWVCVAVIKEFASGYAYIRDTRAPLVGGQPFSVTLSIGGANICQYGFLVYGPNAAPGSDAAAQSARVTVDNSDPSITGRPVSLRRQVGDSATFTVTAVGESDLSYQWSRVQGGVTNALSNGPTISGATSDTLTLTDLQVSDEGTYLVTVTNLAGTRTADAALAVKTPLEYVDFLENGGFEDDPTGQDDSPWQRFESTDPGFGSLQSASDTYLFGGNVNVYEGDYVSFSTFSGQYSGIFQDVPAEPGMIFTGDAWFYNASGDPIPGGAGSSVTNECYLEVQFRAGEVVLQQYTSDFFDYTAVRDTWFNLQATNAGGYGINPPEFDADYLVAPPETTRVRFQITMHNIAGSLGAGSLYYDNASLLLKNPADLSVTSNEGAVELTWTTLAATEYLVQFKVDPTDPTWTDLEIVPGDGTPATRSYPTAQSERVFRVLTL